MMAAPVSARGSFPPEHAGRAERSARPRAGNRVPVSPRYRDGDGGMGGLAPTEPWSSSPCSKLHLFVLEQLLHWVPSSCSRVSK